MKRGVTLLEVLIAILVASVGLLGAIAVFPVAMSQARKGRIADVTAIAGESAIADFQVKGMHERSKWIAWDGANAAQAFVPAGFQQSTSPYFGYAFCIDPMAFSHNAADDPGNWAVWSRFPAVPQASALNTRMHRLTLHGGGQSQLPSLAMTELQADFAFRISDELMYERPADNALPAAQLFTYSDLKDASGKRVPGRRQEEGRLTWFATLAPKIDRLAPRLSDEYVLSIVICRDRASGEALHVNDPANPEHPWNEWTAKILATDFHAAGIGGGEVTITTNDPAQDSTFNDPKYLDLRSGQWVMLGRTLPGANGAIQHFQWYRISDAGETEPRGNRWSQDVSLAGPDWPTDVTAPVGTNEECDVTIMPTVVHVYERTIRIQN